MNKDAEKHNDYVNLFAFDAIDFKANLIKLVNTPVGKPTNRDRLWPRPAVCEKDRYKRWTRSMGKIIDLYDYLIEWAEQNRAKDREELDQRSVDGEYDFGILGGCRDVVYYTSHAALNLTVDSGDRAEYYEQLDAAFAEVVSYILDHIKGKDVQDLSAESLIRSVCDERIAEVEKEIEATKAQYWLDFLEKRKSGLVDVYGNIAFGFAQYALHRDIQGLGMVLNNIPALKKSIPRIPIMLF